MTIADQLSSGNRLLITNDYSEQPIIAVSLYTFELISAVIMALYAALSKSPSMLINTQSDISLLQIASSILAVNECGTISVVLLAAHLF